MIEVPILENSFGNTAVDLTLCLDEFGIDPMRQSFKNLSLTNVIFEFVEDYSLYHDAPILKEAIIEAIRSDVSGITSLIDKRLRKVQYLDRIQYNMQNYCTLLSE
jgi:hypothetical protein